MSSNIACVILFSYGVSELSCDLFQRIEALQELPQATSHRNTTSEQPSRVMVLVELPSTRDF